MIYVASSIKFIDESENVWEEGRTEESEENPLQRVSYWFIRSEFYRKGLAYLRLIYEATYILTYFREFHCPKGHRISRLRGYHKYSKNLHVWR